MKKNASNTTIEEVEESNGGRTVILRDQFSEIVLSSTFEIDTIESLLSKANQQKMLQQSIPPTSLKQGPRDYHG